MRPYLICATLLISLAGCASHENTPGSSTSIGLANPASVYCTKQGGTLDIRHEEQGDVGYCHLPDGRVIEEWQLFRSQNANTGQ